MLDPVGNTLFEGQAGPANWASTPHKTLVGSLQQATAGAPKADAVCACFAGLLTPDDKKRAEIELSVLYPGAKVEARPDYHAALAACPDGTDCCVIAGTGSTVFSWQGDDVVKSGGGGYLLGDRGSAFRYGRAVVQRFFEQPTEVSERILSAIEANFGTRDVSAVVAEVYRRSSPPAFLATFATTLAEEAEAGEAYAKSLIAEESRELAAIVARHIASFASDSDSPCIVLAGGLWQSHPTYRPAFESALAQALEPRCPRISLLETPAVVGAARLARRLIP